MVTVAGYREIAMELSLFESWFNKKSGQRMIRPYEGGRSSAYHVRVAGSKLSSPVCAAAALPLIFGAKKGATRRLPLHLNGRQKGR
jgi:hypothetical protein